METMGVLECASRELMEELHLPPPDIERLRGHKGLHIIGIINDDSSDVGRRHLALVMKYEVSPDRYWESPERGEKGNNSTTLDLCQRHRTGFALAF